MQIRTAAALAAVASFMLAVPAAHAEGRYSFINKYIEKYAKVKPGDKIGNGRFDMNSLSYTGEGSQPGATPSSTAPKKVSSLRSRASK